MFDTLKDLYRGRLVPDEKDGPNRPYIQDLLRLREKIAKSSAKA